MHIWYWPYRLVSFSLETNKNSRDKYNTLRAFNMFKYLLYTTMYMYIIYIIYFLDGSTLSKDLKSLLKVIAFLSLLYKR